MPDLIKPFRELLFSCAGLLGSENYAEYRLFLFNDLLLFRRHQKQILQKVEDIRMSNRLPKVLAEKPHQLCVDFLNGRTLSFACLTAEDASTLLELLSTAPQTLAAQKAAQLAILEEVAAAAPSLQ